MTTIWKWPLRIVDRQTITAPGGTSFLHVAYQGETLCIWGEGDPKNPSADTPIYIVGTGHPVPEGVAYIGTVLDRGGLLVWHVYMGGEA